MINTIINRMLIKYDSASYITKNRARFVLYLILTLLLITPGLILYFFYIHLFNPDYDFKTLIDILIPTSTAFILSIAMLFLLIRGHYSIAGNILLVIWQSALWGIIFIAEEETLIRIDSVVFIAGTLTMMPIIVVKKRCYLLFIQP